MNNAIKDLREIQDVNNYQMFYLENRLTCSLSIFVIAIA
jgi:hypothetical protein